MNPKAVALYYVLSIVVLGTALFAIQPRGSVEVSSWQKNLQTKFSIAWQQTWSDRPYLTDVVAIFDGVSAFYDQAAVAMADLTRDEDSDAAIVLVLGQTYLSLSSVIWDKPSSYVAGESDITVSANNFMTQEPIYDILPTGSYSKLGVSGVSFSAANTSSAPVNLSNPWFTAVDSFTGQTYCMAIYNGEVNKYLGECKYDYQ